MLENITPYIKPNKICCRTFQVKETNLEELYNFYQKISIFVKKMPFYEQK